MQILLREFLYSTLIGFKILFLIITVIIFSGDFNPCHYQPTESLNLSETLHPALPTCVVGVSRSEFDLQGRVDAGLCILARDGLLGFGV